jgi:cell division septation protein DedD
MFTPDPSLPSVTNTEVPLSGPPVSIEPAEFEFVMGRRQVASVSLVVLTLLAAFTGAAYIVGKSAIESVETAKPVSRPTSTPAPPPLVVEKASAPKPEAALFDVPTADGLYLQLGSVERGSATLMVHGARKLGYPSFVGAGTNPNVFRVLVGPFSNQAEFEKAKIFFQAMGLDTFLRHGDSPAPAVPSQP